MSRVDPPEFAAQAYPTEPNTTATFPVERDGEDGMGLRSVTVERFEEIRRRLDDGRGIREISRALGCSRDTVREVRDGLRQSPAAPKVGNDPLWMRQIDWASASKSTMPAIRLSGSNLPPARSAKRMSSSQASASVSCCSPGPPRT